MSIPQSGGGPIESFDQYVCTDCLMFHLFSFAWLILA